MQQLASAGTVKRLWAKDESLWPNAKGQKRLITSNLSCLDLPDQIGPYMTRAAALAATAEREGFRDVVFVAMGDSNLAAETVAHACSPQRPQRFFLLDSTDPAAIQRVSEQLDLDRTLFVFASKSGKRIETHALLLYFMHKLRTHKAAEPGRCFVAVTEEDSYLSELAKNYDFLGSFSIRPGIKGRYSSLIHFGLLLSAIWRLDPQELVTRAKLVRESCKRDARRRQSGGGTWRRFWRRRRRAETTSCCCSVRRACRLRHTGSRSWSERARAKAGRD